MDSSSSNYGFWLTGTYTITGTGDPNYSPSSFSCSGTVTSNVMNLAPCPSTSSESCFIATTGATSDNGCSTGMTLAGESYSLTGVTTSSRNVYLEDGYVNSFIWMCSSGQWVYGNNMNPQVWGCSSSSSDISNVPLNANCPYAVPPRYIGRRHVSRSLPSSVPITAAPFDI